MLPAGKVGQKKGRRTPCRFLSGSGFWGQYRPVPQLHLQGFLYTIHMERLAEGRIVASNYDAKGKLCLPNR